MRLLANNTRTNNTSVTAGVETITPEVAEAMLEGNVVNRNLRQRRVNLYAKQMLQGLWRVTGEAIVFSETGQLLQGQHRLTACIEAGVPFQTVVVRGVDFEAMRVMDTGAARTPGDSLKLEGIVDENNSAAALRRLYAIDGGFPTNPNLMNLITRDDLVGFYQEHQELIEAAREYGAPCRNMLGHSRSMWIVLAFLVMQSDRDLGREFMEGLATGAGLPVGDARLAYAKLLHSKKAQGQTLTWQQVVATGIKTYNKWLNAEDVQRAQVWQPASGWPEVQS